MRPIRVRRSQLDECGIKRGLSADEVLHSIEPSRGDDLPEDFAIEILEDERVVDQEAGALDTPPLVIAFGRCDQCNTDDVWCFWDHTKLNGHWEPVIATCEVCKGNREPEDEKAAA